MCLENIGAFRRKDAMFAVLASRCLVGVTSI